MGNTCCNERGEDNEVLKSAQKKEDAMSNSPGVNKITFNHTGYSPQHTDVNESEIQCFDKEPSSFFTLNKDVLKAIEKHGFYKCYGSDNKSSFNKFEGVASDGRKFKYFGQMAGNQMEGKGQLQFTEPNGEYVVCNFKNGRAEGDGAIYFANGDFFKGKLFDNSMKEGTLYLTNGNKYEGSFVENMYEGQGTFSFVDGRKYKGQFMQGKKHGLGTLNWTNGSSYSGDWIQGHQHGHGKFIDAKGVVHEGQFANGKMLKKKH